MLGFIVVTSFLIGGPYSWTLCKEFNDREKCIQISDENYSFKAFDYSCSVTETRDGQPFQNPDYFIYFRTISCESDRDHQIMVPLGCIYGPEPDTSKTTYLKLKVGRNSLILKLICWI